jgi:hypothetical protein
MNRFSARGQRIDVTVNDEVDQGRKPIKKGMELIETGRSRLVEFKSGDSVKKRT